MTILVTGAAGFIGSNFVKYLNSLGKTDIHISDYLTNGKQFRNLDGLKYTKFIMPEDVCDEINKNAWIDEVFHFGAISDTTNWDGEIVLKRNYQYTINLIDVCADQDVFLSYSSSASVYGNGNGPLNLYAYSKWLVDNEVSRLLKFDKSLKIQGFRYFNVYGPGEWHKEKQASPYYQFEQQALESGVIKIFEGSENYRRDFVSVDTVCQVQYQMAKKATSGIFDLGSGTQRTFKEVAEEIALKNNARVIEIPFPDHLREHYQFNTLADMSIVNSIINT